jgi:hypothetical protein
LYDTLFGFCEDVSTEDVDPSRSSFVFTEL